MHARPAGLHEGLQGGLPIDLTELDSREVPELDSAMLMDLPRASEALRGLEAKEAAVVRR